MKHGNSLVNRLTALVMAALLVVGMLPTGLAQDAKPMGTVEPCHSGMTLTGDSNDLHAEFTGELQWFPADPSIGRYQDGWWAGVNVIAPDMTAEELQQVKYLSGSNERSFVDFRDSKPEDEKQYIGLWIPVQESYLREANVTDGKSSVTWSFDWDGDGTFEQDVTIDVLSAETVLLDADGNQVYPAPDFGFGTVESLVSGGTVTGSGTAQTGVDFSNITVEWEPQDDSIGRYQDGWWVGAKVTVPAGMTEEQVKDISLRKDSVYYPFWEFKDSAEGADAHYITVWMPINGVQAGSVESRTYSFDWNNDGLYDQDVVLSVDEDTTTLLKSGVQLYPELGQVTSYQGGTVTGSGTGSVTVLEDNVSLDWAPADPSIGRENDAWWVGIKVVAPESLTTDQLQNAVYQVKTSVTAEWSAATRSFWANQDTQGSETPWIQMWFSLTPESLQTFKTENRHMSMCYRFDWDGNGTYEQEITFSLDPNGQIELKKKPQTGFTFTKPAPEDVWVGLDTYENPAIGGQGDGAVTYDIVAGENATIDPATGILTWTGVGTVTVKATKAADSKGFYEEATATYTVTAIRDNQTPQFTTTQPSELTYEPGLTYTNTLTGFMDETAKITYSVVDGEGVATVDPDTGKVTVLKAGTVTIEGKVAQTDLYNEAGITYTLVINKAQQPDFAFDNPPTELNWQAESLEALAVKDGLGEGEVVWTVIEGADVAEVDAEGKLTLLKSGTFTLQAQKLGDDCYLDSAAVTTTIVVHTIGQTGFGFGETESVELTYNDNDNRYTLQAAGGESEGAVTYGIYSGDAASVDAATGEVTLLKSGVVVIEAVKAADSRYDAAYDRYILTIHKDTQPFTFERGAENNALYGTLSFENAVVFDDNHSESSMLVYTLEDNNLGAVIDGETGKITFADSEGKVGTLTVTATKAADDCYEEATATYTLTVAYQTTDSKPTVTGDTLNDSGWYTGNVQIHAPEGFSVSYANELSTSDWSEAVSFTEEGPARTATVYLKDENGFITDAVTVEELYLDATAPEVSVSYSKPVVERIVEGLSFGFYTSQVEITVTVNDASSGAESFTMTYERQTGASEVNLEKQVFEAAAETITGTLSQTFTLEAQARGSVSVKALDAAGNVTVLNEETKVVVVDNAAPNITVTYKADTTEGVVSFPYNNFPVTAEVAVTESNFMEGKTAGEDNDEVVHDLILKVTRVDDNGNVTVTEYLPAGAAQLVDGAAPQEIAWTAAGDTYTTELTLSEDGDYVLELQYKDLSGNESAIKGTDGIDGEVTYTSQVITIDTTAPKIELEYDNNSAENGNYYRDSRAATITVTEHNFKAEDFAVQISAADIFDQSVTPMNYAEFAANPANWSHDESGNVHTLVLKFTADGTYKFDLSYTDLAGNAAADFEDQSFAVDHVNPEEVTISYSSSIIDRVIRGVTFGFYHAEAVITVSAVDKTSGIDYFRLTYTIDPDASAAHTGTFTEDLEAVADKDDPSLFTAEFTLPAEARGSFKVEAFDKSGRSTEEEDTENMIVTDTVAPNMEVSFSGTGNVHFVDATGNDVDDFTKADRIYYNANASALFTVEEANFFEGISDVHEVRIYVTYVDDDGNRTLYEYIPEGGGTTAPGAQAVMLDWSSDGDVHTAEIVFSEDGDYTVEVQYTDFSGNSAGISGSDGNSATAIYTAKTITVDKTAPQVSVVYDMNTPAGVQGDRKYFGSTRTATVTVTEHNFRASDVAAAVTAVDFLGADVTVENFAAQLRDANAWTHKDNEHTATIRYSVDANYTFDIDLVDLAGNAYTGYAGDAFTVDKTAPTDLTITYSTGVLETILETVTFGYYNAAVRVTVTATDPTSGIQRFVYSYVNHEGVSAVNAQLLDQVISSAQITHQGATGSAVFSIPKSALGPDNQFNGTVRFSAVNYGGHTAQFGDTRRIVVDNISPTATVSYSAPTQKKGSNAYYNKAIDVTVTVNEANFYASDMVVQATRDGQTFTPGVTWTAVSADQHKGTFRLAENGTYVLTLRYQDRSGNKMTNYTSDTLILDATSPAIKVSGITANSANKDDVFGFSIEISDNNMDPAAMKPVLTAVLQNAEGVYETVEIDLGNAEQITEDQKYRYTVKNLADDALYTLTCKANDRAGNASSTMKLDDGKNYESVQFSVNRNGSTFGYGSDYTRELAENYYVYSVNEDLVVVEVNVDPIESWSVSLNGKELAEGTDYTTSQTSEPGSWSKRTYTVNKSLFDAEGEYSVIVSSTDKTETTSFSDVKDLALAFVVDRTKPVITITGLENGGRYQTDYQTVTLIPMDEGGRLDSLKVVVLDAEGNPLMENGTDASVRFDLSGQELLDYLEQNDGRATFTVPSGLNNQVQILCSDCVTGGEVGATAYTETFDGVTVSQNQMVILYANTPLFIGIIAGAVAIAAAAIILIRRKKIKA